MYCKKFLGILTATVAAVCSVCPTTSAVRTNTAGDVAMTALADSVYDEYREWSQLDPRWKDTPMGGTTIRRSGCLVTSLAIMAVHSGSVDSSAFSTLGISSVEEFNPGVLANAYTRVGGFSSGGAISSWGTINKLIPNITFGFDTYFKNTSKQSAAAEIRDLMANDWHIIARVNSPSGYHWVYIESVGDDDSITMCDPAMDTHDLYAAYPGGLQGEYWAVKGKNPPAAVVEYEPSLDIELTSLPDKTVYQQGEEIDLSGMSAALTGTDPKKGEWTEKCTDIYNSDKITVDTSAFDNTTAGEYEIKVLADTGYASAETSFTVTVCRESGEYTVSGELPVPVYSDKTGGTPIFTLNKGNIVQISECDEKYGFIISGDTTVYVEVEQLVKTEDRICEKGDINNDGVIDKYDLSLLNTYLQQAENLPDGVTTLTSTQLESADINGDGKVDYADVREYLTII